jgi:hypothetical protein
MDPVFTLEELLGTTGAGAGSNFLQMFAEGAPAQVFAGAGVF